MSLNDFNADDFLARDWQRQPRLLRDALPGFACPLDGNDLAGLACEDEVESRLIIGAGDDWQVRHGPFEEADFSTLPKKDWTLLVQAVDQWVPEVAELLAHFDFIPRWRVDDIMISYAVTGGGVGPHFDRYDVFLIQGSGRRRWRIGQSCDDNTPLKPDLPLHQLCEFETVEDHVLEAGDILYLPPGVAHWGEAVNDDCITLSVGFRAPSHAELLSHSLDNTLAQLGESRRFSDPAGSLQAGGRISMESLQEVQRILQSHQPDINTITQWFGRLMTEPKYPEHLPEADTFQPDELREELQQGATLEVALHARLTLAPEPAPGYFFADGNSFPLTSDTAELAALLADTLPGQTIDSCRFQNQPAALCLLVTLLNQGSLTFSDADY